MPPDRLRQAISNAQPNAMNPFSADELFRMRDNRVPLQTEKAIRGLITPFESLFPDSCVPHDVEAALPFLSMPARHSPKQPEIFSSKKEWIEWIFWEVKLRLELAVRFLELDTLVSHSPNPPPIILFLREFRGVSHIADGDISIMTGGAESDIQMRERIEEMFPECLVFWVASPKDAISYCFARKVNRNSYPYFAPRDWLKCVEVIAKSANLIVMANTSTAEFFEWEVDTALPHARNLSSSQGGVAQEIALLKEFGLVDRAFFCNAEKVMPQLGHVKSVADLAPDFISSGVSGSYKDIFDLPPMEHWLDLESIDYAGEFMGAIDNAWGYAHDVAKRRMTGDVIAALFMAMAALAVVRGDLAATAELHLDLANMMQRRPNYFLPIDAIAESALRESAQWYQDNAKLFSAVYRIRFMLMVEPRGEQENAV